MKIVLAIFLTLCLIVSCSSSSAIDTTEFNQYIEQRKDINTPEDLIHVYYDYPESEGNSKMTITTKELHDDEFEITLIHNGIGDDSVSAMRIVMVAKKNNQTWTVLSIRESWKCHKGRGHGYWGGTKCG